MIAYQLLEDGICSELCEVCGLLAILRLVRQKNDESLERVVLAGQAAILQPVALSGFGGLGIQGLAVYVFAVLAH